MASLLRDRRFAPLFWCQLLAAFGDNALKSALTFVLVWGIGGTAAKSLTVLAGAVFIAPFFLLSGLGGELADRLDKALLARRIKFAELGAAGLAAAGIWLGSVPVLFAALLAFGIASALFGPVKYGILPDQLAPERLPAANALVEAATFLAILAGTVAGGLATTAPRPLAVAVAVFSALAWVAARLIPPAGRRAPDLPVRANVLASTAALLRDLWADGRAWRAALFSTWFWVAGSVALALLPSLVKDVLGGGEGAATLALCLFAVGVGLGSGAAAWLSGGRIVLLPCALGAAAVGVGLLDLWWTARGLAPVGAEAGARAFLALPGRLHVLLDLVALAAGGGLIAVPSFAAVQAWAGEEHRARSVAAVNVLSAGAMVAGAAVTAILQRAAGLDTPALLGLLGAASLAVAAVMLVTQPTNPLRDALWLLFRAAYRVRVTGWENLDRAGPRAVVALTHVSWLDAALALAILPGREPVFAIDRGIARRWWVRPFLRLVRAMPLDPTKPLATRTLIQAVRAGEPLVIFPEGRLTVTGSLMKVYDGAALIADKGDAAVVPVRAKGLEATPFTRLRRSQVRRRWFPRVEVSILEPVRLGLDPELRGRKRREAGGAALYDVMSDLVWRTARLDRTVFEAVVAAAREHGRGRTAVEDPVSGSLSYRKLLAGAAVLGRALENFAVPGGAVGVMLPTSNAAAVTVLGLASAGRVPAMLNFTAGVANLLAACRAAEVGAVVTSRAFLEQARLGALAEMLGREVRLVLLEDLRAGLGRLDRLRGLWQGGRPLAARRPDDPAAILFTSGSEGTPKGVVLSHRNLLANVAQVAARIDFGREDKVFNALPVFHSFGLTAGLFLPLATGVPVFLYPSPLHYRIVPELVYGSNATVLFGTDTFLAGYARTAHPYDFRSLRYVVAGAEPVRVPTRAAWMERFGLRVLEGYGVTETAPVLALNTPMFNRTGTVGRLLPGIEARLEPVPGIDAEAGQRVGRLWVRGANVMMGYLRAERPGALEPPAEGWHDTGDVVALDEGGFVRIQGRAKRFAKVGGEMVSLAAVEAVAAELWPDRRLAVTAVPDARKGERLVLLTEEPSATRPALLAHARSRGLAEIAVPAEVRVVPAIPLLGSGKVDFAAVRHLAETPTAAVGAAA